MAKIVKPLRSGQITIPADFRERLGISSDSLLQITLAQDSLIVKPIKTVKTVAGSSWLKELYEYFAPVRAEVGKQGLSEQEADKLIDRAVKAVRSKHA